MKKILMFIGGVIVVAVVIILIVAITSKKMVCKSNEGNITLMYNSKTLTGYTANGITFDLDGQKSIADQIGIDAYLDEFEDWFQTNTTGTCTR